MKENERSFEIKCLKCSNIKKVIWTKANAGIWNENVDGVIQERMRNSLDVYCCDNLTRPSEFDCPKCNQSTFHIIVACNNY